MSDKNLVFLLALVFGVFLGKQPVFSRYEYDEGKRIVRRATPMYAFLLFLPVILMTCLGRPRGDTYLYLLGYDRLPFSLGEMVRQLEMSDQSGIGFTIFEMLIKLFVGSNQTAFRMFLALAHAIPVIVIYRKYSDDYGLSVFLFLAYGCHLAWMMNGLRQFLACVLIFRATPWMIRREYFKLIVVILIATLIHTSAIIMLPIVFIVQGKAWNWKTILLIIIASIGTVIFANVEGSFDRLLVGTEYENTMSTMQKYGDDGVNPIRFLVAAVPMVLALFGKRALLDDNDTFLNICINMSIITTCINLVAMVTSGIMVGRLPVYTNLYNFILLPTLFQRLFTSSSRKVITSIAVILYIGYYYVECGF